MRDRYASCGVMCGLFVQKNARDAGSSYAGPLPMDLGVPWDLARPPMEVSSDLSAKGYQVSQPSRLVRDRIDA